MKTPRLSRRSILQGAAVTAAGLAYSNLHAGSLLPTAFGQVAEEKPALLVIFLSGGYNAMFGSADSFIPAGTFGATSSNVKSLGNGLVVDNATYGTLPTAALQRMATVGIRHGITSHDGAQRADWGDGTRSYALRLAYLMGGDASIKCAVVGNRMPPGPRTSENGVSYQSITDMKTTIAALGGATDPSMPKRELAAKGLESAEAMSQNRFNESQKSLAHMQDGFSASIATLQKPVQSLDYNALATAYGITATTTAVNNFRTQLVAAELMVRAGTNVICAVDGGWDTHGDRNGATVRAQMNTRILPPLKVFLERTLSMTGRNVAVAILGDFARSLPGSDHANSLNSTVIGKYVKVGTTGKMSATVGLPSGSPNVPQYWAYLASIMRVGGSPFGANPHTNLVQVT